MTYIKNRVNRKYKI